MFGGDTDVSSAQGQSVASINSSGWVVGKGSASGGSLSASSSSGFKLPNAALISLAAIALAFVYFKSKKGR